MLPELPRILKKREAEITPRIVAWLERNYPNTCAFEIKIKGNKEKPHQTIALRQVDAGTFAWKIPDMGRRNPFDGFLLKKADALTITYDPTTRECVATSPSGIYIKFKP